MFHCLIIAAALACIWAAVSVLAAGWRRGRVSTARRVMALLLGMTAAAIWIAWLGAEIGIPLLLETAALTAFGYILTRSETRPPQRERAERVVAAPVIPARRWPGAARFLVAGPLGFAAAMGIALLFATRGPGAEQTRIIVAGLIVPSLWAVAIGWIAADRRLPVQAATFCAVGLLGFGTAMLTGA